MTRSLALFFTAIISLTAAAQQRDTLKLTITKFDKYKIDTVFYYSSRIDTIALQPVKTDTSKIVKDINPQDLAESKYKIRFMGSVRVNGYYDFNGMTSTEGFLPYDIPVGEEKIEGLSSVYIGGRQSKFGMEGTANTKVGSIKTYLEVDFVSSTGSFWRLRHAFAEWNYFKIGHTWTTFMDNASLPSTIDFEGPNSAVSKRHGVVRYERKLTENSIAGLSLESPQTDYYNPADSVIINKNKQGDLDIAGRYKFAEKWGHVQMAGIFRRISYLHGEKMDKLYGWGLLASTILHINEKNTLYSQYSIGEGIAHYVVGFENRQLDAVYDSSSANMKIKMTHGGYICYNHELSPKLKLSLTGGISFLDGYNFETEDTFYSSQYLAANCFYHPIETIGLGIELTTGTRTNLDKQRGNATRISMMAKFDF